MRGPCRAKAGLRPSGAESYQASPNEHAGRCRALVLPYHRVAQLLGPRVPHRDGLGAVRLVCGRCCSRGRYACGAPLQQAQVATGKAIGVDPTGPTAIQLVFSQTIGVVILIMAAGFWGVRIAPLEVLGIAVATLLLSTGFAIWAQARAGEKPR